MIVVFEGEKMVFELLGREVKHLIFVGDFAGGDVVEVIFEIIAFVSEENEVGKHGNDACHDAKNQNETDAVREGVVVNLLEIQERIPKSPVTGRMKRVSSDVKSPLSASSST